jgi:hypothetical protein
VVGVVRRGDGSNEGEMVLVRGDDWEGEMVLRGCGWGRWQWQGGWRCLW